MAEHVRAEDLTRRGLSLDWLSSHAGAVLWVESSAETGPDVLMSLADEGAVRTTLPAGIGNRLHAYGARPYLATSAGIVATRAGDGQVWNLGTGTRLTDTEHQHGDLTADNGRVCCVREGPDGDDLLVIDTATGGVDVVHRAPFLAAPHLHGNRLAWTQWADDVMPWDAAEVWVGRYRPGARVEDRRRVAGGPGEAAHQPSWGRDGHLYLLSDRSGWWNLYRWRHELESVAPMAAECGAAPWESGYASYAFLDRGRIAMIAENGPRSRIVVVEPDGAVGELAMPFTSVKPFLAPTPHGVAVIGAGPDSGPRVAVLSTDGSGTTRMVRSGGTPPYTAREPTILTVDSTEPLTVLVHPPGPGHGSPAPLIVRAHPGPTDNNRLRLDEEVQFFTSRGFTLAEVDYRGSTGYGRRFRTALDGRWGDLDVDDCIAAARHLVENGQAQADAVFIAGASAGGYTALRAVSRSDTPFALAVARSAVVHPNRWVTTAPRFQRAHAATLAHHAADVDPAAVRRPVLLIHGRDDDVAPLDDVSELADALRQRGLLVRFVDLPGVGHYLSGPGLVTALTSELAAYEQYLSSRSA
ncbi:MAG: prolyl oligopeptidase family serine peptidase [Pseudonocardia sp.]|nr:prolyl oligopeptidase family serine peptidase [Pseudonocardia sp.]